jgi:putative peptidoglycan lipid II flippase
MDKYTKPIKLSASNGAMRNLAQTAVLMAMLTLCSKLLGFIREMIMANYYGTSYVVDAYVMSTALPGILFGGIFVSIATAYIPIYSKITENQGEKEGNKFTSEIINFMLLVSICASIIGIFFSDQLVSIFAGGFSGETAKLTSYFVKVTFAYTLFSSTAGVIDAYLQYKGVFMSQIIAGFAQNIMVIAVIIISAYSSFYYLAFGMLLGVAFRLLIVSIISRKKEFKYSITFTFNNAARNIAILAVPVFIGSSMQQVSTFVDKTLASGLPEGSVSALNYAMLLILLITNLTTGIFTTIVYPKLAQANSLEDYIKLNDIVSKGMTLILMISIPCTLGAILYSKQIVQIVYERGAFDAGATALTSSAFIFYAIGLTFMAVNDLLTKVYYSMHNMKLPMIFAGISVIIDIVLNLILVRYMAHNGLALATSIGFISNTIFLLIGLRYKYPQIKALESKTKITKIIIASILAVAVSWAFYNFMLMELIKILVVKLMLTVGIAAILYLIIIYFFKIDEIKLLKQIIRKKQI